MSIVIKSGTSTDLAAVSSNNELKVALSAAGHAAQITTAGELKVDIGVERTPFGNLNVSIDPSVWFTDTFEGVTFDTTNRWNTYGTVAVTQTQGSVSLNPGNTANATTAVAGQASILINMPVTVGFELILESGSIATGIHRFAGVGTVAGNVGTAAAPITDGIGFEIDTGGTLRASVYNTGTRVGTQVLTTPSDGLPHLYVMELRGDISFFYIDTFDTPVAVIQVGPASQLLPLRLHRLNTAAVSGTGVMTVSSLAALDQARQSTGLADGTYPWRKATVDRAGALATAVQSPSITGNGPSSVASAITNTLLLAANSIRRGATITNDSTTVLFVSLGTTAASLTSYTVRLPAAAYYEVPFGYTGEIRGIWASANGNARITEVVGL